MPPPLPVARVQSYLAIVGAPPLRFVETPPPPETIPHLTLAAAPTAPLPGHSSDPANDITLQPASAAETPAATNPATGPNDTPPQAAAITRTPPPIIPDELRPRVRPEDFLPFFQLPATSSDTTVPLPRSAATPGQLPASSATYTQTPR